MAKDPRELIDSLVSGVASMPPVNPDLAEEEDEDNDEIASPDTKGVSKKKKPTKTPINYQSDYVAELERSDNNNEALF